MRRMKGQPKTKGYDAKASFGITQAQVGWHGAKASGLQQYAKTSLGRAARIAMNEAILSIVNTMGSKAWKGKVIDVPDEDRITLHDLQYDYVRYQADDLQALNNNLLTAYSATCNNR